MHPKTGKEAAKIDKCKPIGESLRHLIRANLPLFQAIFYQARLVLSKINNNKRHSFNSRGECGREKVSVEYFYVPGILLHIL